VISHPFFEVFLGKKTSPRNNIIYSSYIYIFIYKKITNIIRKDESIIRKKSQLYIRKELVIYLFGSLFLNQRIVHKGLSRAQGLFVPPQLLLLLLFFSMFVTDCCLFLYIVRYIDVFYFYTSFDLLCLCTNLSNSRS
jgi:hypothetical protein